MVYLVLPSIIQGQPAGDSGIPVYPKKIRQNTPKHPKFLPIYLKLIKALYSLLYTRN